MENKKLKLKLKALKHAAVRRWKQFAIAGTAAVAMAGATTYAVSQQKTKSKEVAKTEFKETSSTKKKAKEIPVGFIDNVLGYQVIKYGNKNESDSLLVGIRHYTGKGTEEPIYIKLDSTCIDIDIRTNDIKIDKESGNLYFGYHLKVLPNRFNAHRYFEQDRNELETFKVEKGLVHTEKPLGGYTLLEDIRPLTQKEKELIDSVNNDNIRKLLEFYYTQSPIPLKHELKPTDAIETIHKGSTKITYYDYLIDGKQIEEERIKWEKARRIKVYGLSKTIRVCFSESFDGRPGGVYILEPDSERRTEEEQFIPMGSDTAFKDMVVFEFKNDPTVHLEDKYASIKRFIENYKSLPVMSEERGKKAPSPKDTNGIKPRETKVPNPRIINRRRERKK